MKINEDVRENIIIYAQGEYQIKLLMLIYHCINKYNGTKFTFGNVKLDDNEYDIVEKFLDTHISRYSASNSRADLLYVPNIDKYQLSDGVIYTKRKLEAYYTTKNLSSDHWIDGLCNKISLSHYKLVSVKYIIERYGKYLFLNDKNNYHNFMSTYSSLENCNIYKSLKNINIL